MASLSSSTLPRLLGAEASSMAVGDLPSAIARPQEKLPSKVVKQFSEELAAAIQAGNVSKAQQLAAMLAQGHARLTVSFDPDAHDNRPSEQEISVTVHVEDRESAGLALSDVKVRPTDSILDLKRTFLGKYGFPLEVQKWIIGNRIPNDEETLSRCGVHSSGSTLYLYLLSARAANITRDDYRRQWQGHTPGGPHRVASRPKSGDYESLCMPFAPPATQGPQSSGQGHGQVQSSSTSSAARQQSQLSTSGSANSLPTPSLGLSDLRSTDPGVSTQNLSEHTSGQRAPEVRQGQGQGEDLLPGVGEPLAASSGVERFLLQGVQTGPPPQEQQSMLGWQCITCTLINQPTRPGCEACGSPRPVDYEVPSEYVVSEEERQRLEREQHLEALMQQASGHGWVQGQEQGGTSLLPLPTTSELGNNRPLTAEQLDLILRFNDAIQQHLSTSGTANQGAVAGGVQQGVNSQVLPSGLRQPVQNVELGEEEPDMLLGWVSGDENDHLSA